MRALLPPQPAVRHRATTKLKLDYLGAILANGAMVSFPALVDAHIERALQLDIPSAIEVLERESQQAVFLEIVDVGVRRKKCLKAYLREDVRAMVFPATIQPLTVWNAHAYPCDQVSVYTEGFPRTVDILRLAPWPVLRSSLRVWEKGASDVQGCYGLFQSQLASLMDWDLMDANTPALVVLETLASRGWELGGFPDAHT